MARDDVLVEIRSYRADLAAELARIDSALNALGEVAGDDAPPAHETGTYALLRAFALQQPRFDASGALCYLVENGWQADDRTNALNTVRTALSHLASWGEIERVRRGVYCLRSVRRLDVPPAPEPLMEATG